MTTTAQIIERTKRKLYGGEVRDERDKLSASVDTDDVSLSLAHGRSGIQEGAVVAIDLEEMFVEARTSTTATVIRGEAGSTAAAHASGAAIFINPKFSAFAILDAVNDELSALSGEGLFKVAALSITNSPGTDAYDLTGVTEVRDILAVEYDANDGTERWSTLDRNQWRLRRNLPTSDFPSGTALTINGYVAPGMTMRVTYKAPYTALSTISDNVETISGLHAAAHDILPLGAAIRLTSGDEIARNFLEQADTRRADEVPPTARLGMMRSLLNLRQDRINAEKARLYAKYPMVR